MAGSSQRQDKSSPPLLIGFSSIADADVDDDTFLSGGRRRNESSTLEDRRQQLLEEKRRVEMKTLESSFRSLNMLNESEHIGNATAEELTRQREQLENADTKLDQINSSLKSSQKHIRGIKSWFGGIKNYFSNSNKPETTPIKSSASTSSDVDADKEQAPPRRSKLAEVLENHVEPTRDPVHPTERFRSNAFLESKDVDELLDRNLNMMGDSLGRLKMLGLSLQDELGQQNELVDRITVKSEDVDCKMGNQNKDISRILKK